MTPGRNEDQNREDQLWLATVAAGGPAAEGAAEMLFRRYRKPLLAFLLQRQADYAVAEDLVQETFLRAFQNAGGFRGESKVSSWLFTIARNRFLDRVRAPVREEVKSEDEWSRIAEDPAVTAKAQDALIDKDFNDCTERGYAEFAEAHPAAAEVLKMVYQLGWSGRDIAHFLQRTEGATREYVSQCRKRLRRFLEPCQQLREGVA